MIAYNSPSYLFHFANDHHVIIRVKLGLGLGYVYLAVVLSALLSSKVKSLDLLFSQSTASNLAG